MCVNELVFVLMCVCVTVCVCVCVCVYLYVSTYVDMNTYLDGLMQRKPQAVESERTDMLVYVWPSIHTCAHKQTHNETQEIRGLIPAITYLHIACHVICDVIYVTSCHMMCAIICLCMIAPGVKYIVCGWLSSICATTKTSVPTHCSLAAIHANKHVAHGRSEQRQLMATRRLAFRHLPRNMGGSKLHPYAPSRIFLLNKSRFLRGRFRSWN